MKRNSKYILIALALGSLASVRCTPAQVTKIDSSVAQANVIVAACSLDFPPAPPPAFWMAEDGCFGVSLCSEDINAQVAAWVVELAKWARDAQECIWAVKDVIRK